MSKWIWITIAVLLIGLAAYSAVCPCGPTPGLYLWGATSEEPVDDWSFVDEVKYCQLEVQTWRPHSITLNCMADDDGTLYISCSQCANKSWSQTAVDNGVGRIRAGDLIYPVSLTRVTDPAELDHAWLTRADKVKREPSPRPDHWWSFRLSSM